MSMVVGGDCDHVGLQPRGCAFVGAVLSYSGWTGVLGC